MTRETDLLKRISDLEEQLAFWMGEGNDHTVEEKEWLTLANISPEKRSPEQSKRIQFLGRFIMEADADYWRSRAARAEQKLQKKTFVTPKKCPDCPNEQLAVTEKGDYWCSFCHWTDDDGWETS